MFFFGFHLQIPTTRAREIDGEKIFGIMNPQNMHKNVVWLSTKQQSGRALQAAGKWSYKTETTESAVWYWCKSGNPYEVAICTGDCVTSIQVELIMLVCISTIWSLQQYNQGLYSYWTASPDAIAYQSLPTLIKVNCTLPQCSVGQQKDKMWTFVRLHLNLVLTRNLCLDDEATGHCFHSWCSVK